MVEEGAQRPSRNHPSTTFGPLTALSTAIEPSVAVRDVHREPGQMAWAYILRCSDGSYYAGSTVDLDERLKAHQEGRGAAYTRHRRPVVLVWAAEFESVAEAFAFEKRVQGWGRRKREALIAGDLASLPVLASRGWRAREIRAGRSGDAV